jgi:hypothetical protein
MLSLFLVGLQPSKLVTPRVQVQQHRQVCRAREGSSIESSLHVEQQRERLEGNRQAQRLAHPLCTLSAAARSVTSILPSPSLSPSMSDCTKLEELIMVTRPHIGQTIHFTHPCLPRIRLVIPFTTKTKRTTHGASVSCLALYGQRSACCGGHCAAAPAITLRFKLLFVHCKTHPQESPVACHG